MFGIDQAKAGLSAIRKKMEENRDYLIEIDSHIGDGDLGLTMVKAFAAADVHVTDSEESDIGKLFMHTGMAMSKAAPSTMGTLIGGGFMRAGKTMIGKTELNTLDFAKFLRAFSDGIMDLGKTKIGNKTIVDVLNPSAEAAEKVVNEGGGFSELVAAVYRAAVAGNEATKHMISQHGKAAVYREQTKGRPDPGATAGLFLIDGLLSSFNDTDQITRSSNDAL